MKYTCKKCGHAWTPRTKMPTACPACHCAKWNGDAIPPPADTSADRVCLRCGYKWKSRKPHTSKCPACLSKLWNTPRKLRLSARRKAKPKSAPRRSSAPRKPHPYKAATE